MNKLPYISQVRRALKVKGTSEHSGRGSYDCMANVGTKELLKRVRAALPKWQKKGIVEKVEETNGCISVDFVPDYSNDEFVGDCYRGFVFPAFELKGNVSVYCCYMMMDAKKLGLKST